MTGIKWKYETVFSMHEFDKQLHLKWNIQIRKRLNSMSMQTLKPVKLVFRVISENGTVGMDNCQQ